MNCVDVDIAICDEPCHGTERKAALRRLVRFGSRRLRDGSVSASTRARKERASTGALTKAVWFVGLYGISVTSFGALVGSVRWTLALV